MLMENLRLQSGRSQTTATGPVQSHTRSSSMAALGTMEPPANVGWLALQIMNLDYPEAGTDVRLHTPHWRNRPRPIADFHF